MVSGLCRTLTEHLVGQFMDSFSNKKDSTTTNNYMLQEPHGALTIFEERQEV